MPEQDAREAATRAASASAATPSASTPSASEVKPPRPQRGLRRYPWVADLEVNVLGFLIHLLLRVVGATVRFEHDGAEELKELWRKGSPTVIGFWHGRCLMLPMFYTGSGACILHSTHRDGRMISRALEMFGIESRGGSSSRGAVGGARALLRAVSEGKDVALIPDGPRGPAGEAKPGVVEIALSSGAPLFPVSVSATRCIRFSGWDRMLLPLPGARVVVTVGEPLREGRVTGDRDARRAQREELRLEFSRRLCAASRRADHLCGRPEEDT